MIIKKLKLKKCNRFFNKKKELNNFILDYLNKKFK